MKKRKGFSLQRLINEYVIVGAGRDTIDFNKVIRLNETSAFIWNEMGNEDFTVEQLANALCAEYNVDDTLATQAVIKTIDSLRDAGVIED